jgi:hypothetical protein
MSAEAFEAFERLPDDEKERVRPLMGAQKRKARKEFP